MTWFAIARPDGEIIEGTVRRDKMTAWRGMTAGDQGQIAGYMLGGYRCVEVQLVEVTAPTGGAESKEEV